ncbi:MAG: metal-sensing transcriptional repressor [Clostridia bacterium]|nr:metal-sensing transcriptional repressor [Clostridia bacterium]
MSDLQHKHHHHHSEEHKREVSNRLARAIGHLQKVKQMVEDDEDCSDVLVQLAAVKSAINNTGKVILKDHMEHCIVHAVEDGDTEMIDELNAAIDKFMK